MKPENGSFKQVAMTPGALLALDNAGLSRRNFLKRTGALIVTFSMAGGSEKLAAQDVQPRPTPLNQVDSWIAIAQDETILGFSGKCEFGQGFETVQHQLIAEELGVPLERVWLTFCDTFLTPDQGVTSGSQSHPAEFGPNGPRQAVATAREALFQMAAQRLNVSADQLTVRDGVISVKADPSRQVSYGQLIGDKRFNLTVNTRAVPEDPSEYTVLGTSVPRYDIPAKVLGTFRYAQNVRLPGMLHGTVIRPPAVGAKLIRVDESSVRGMPGNVKVVVKNDFVGVVADKEWDAIQAAGALQVQWTDGAALPNQDELYDWMRRQPTRDSYTVLANDVDEKLKEAVRVVSATYRHPYQMHGSLASSCAVADVRGSGSAAAATIWSATQGVYPQRDSVAMVLGIPRESVSSSSRDRVVTGSTAPTPSRMMPRCCRKQWAGLCGCSSRGGTKWPPAKTTDRHSSLTCAPGWMRRARSSSGTTKPGR
jgi:CO/xanthine dehydrogenase Mo-binding subunit